MGNLIILSGDRALGSRRIGFDVFTNDELAFREILARLAEDPGFREFARPDIPLFAWSLDGARLIWASPAAAGLGATVTQGTPGEVSSSFPARFHLRALGHGLAPAHGARLERIRFVGNRLAPPLTCACRRITLPSGEDALLTAIVTPLPKGSVDTRGSSGGDVSGGKHEPSGASRPSGISSGARDDSRPRAGTVRFLWRTDPQGRFTERSDTLAEVVGRAGAAILGRSWSEIEGQLVHDPHGAVSGLFAGRSTWGGQTVQWRIAGSDRVVAVELAAMPEFGGAREFLGFRGFGLCRLDRQSEWRHGPPEEAADPQAADPKEEAREPRGLSHLSAEERTAFREIARALGARFEDNEPPPDRNRPAAEIVRVRGREPAHPQTVEVLDRLPVGILIHRGETALFANRALLELNRR
jgi:hypothetical protein